MERAYSGSSVCAEDDTIAASTHFKFAKAIAKEKPEIEAGAHALLNAAEKTGQYDEDYITAAFILNILQTEADVPDQNPPMISSVNNGIQTKPEGERSGFASFYNDIDFDIQNRRFSWVSDKKRCLLLEGIELQVLAVLLSNEEPLTIVEVGHALTGSSGSYYEPVGKFPLAMRQIKSS